jgi:hypothetical protein
MRRICGASDTLNTLIEVVFGWGALLGFLALYISLASYAQMYKIATSKFNQGTAKAFGPLIAASHTLELFLSTPDV